MYWSLACILLFPTFWIYEFYVYVHMYVFLVLFFFLSSYIVGFFGFFKKAVGKRDMELEEWEGGMALGENEGMESQYCTKNFNKK